ncbi:phosphorylase family protein [Blattabacterium cuenoti]|uniref:phosphorylase family protein n=1 Tax=Blattabacterium cuenoti TaxID=1653831 RepID=UPI00163C3695|nr:purine-nucleoside phosphorylase [Blattabacterium cuenoti]
MSINLEKSKQYIKEKVKEKPDIGIFLLGFQNQFHELIQNIKDLICIPYKDIPILKHLYGKLLFGKMNNKNIIFFMETLIEIQKINHHYFPIILCKNIGINKLIFINESYGVNPNYKIGDVMFIQDHINFFPEKNKVKKLIKNNFWEIIQPYDQNMLEIAENIAMNHNIMIQKGIYVSIPYFNYRTYAEYSMIRSMGGDCIGMDLPTDVLIAKYMNIKIFAITMIIMIESYKKKHARSFFIPEIEPSISLVILIINDLIQCY